MLCEENDSLQPLWHCGQLSPNPNRPLVRSPKKEGRPHKANRCREYGLGPQDNPLALLIDTHSII